MAVGTGVARIDSYQNSDGLLINYSKNSWPYNVPRGVISDPANFLIMDVDLTKIGTTLTGYPADLNNDGTTDGFSDQNNYLPAGASVTSVTWITTEIAVGGTSWELGTYSQDGTIVDRDGLMTSTEGVIANMDHVGDRIMGNGAYVATTAGTSGVGTSNEYVALYVTGTFTAGKARVIVRYFTADTGVGV